MYICSSEHCTELGSPAHIRSDRRVSVISRLARTRLAPLTHSVSIVLLGAPLRPASKIMFRQDSVTRCEPVSNNEQC